MSPQLRVGQLEYFIAQSSSIKIPGGFSCDWNKYSDTTFFLVPLEWHNLSEIDFCVKRLLKVQGTIHPLAYLRMTDPCILFEADGQYYYINCCNDFLVRYGREFVSDDDFLTRRLQIKSVVEEFPLHSNQQYAAVCEEQRALEQKASQKRYGWKA
ncbi:hypothetical protein B0H10DRAFT_2217073 [Mycena sp. CBHHK59/15]|nr:hypothetical protein B0H10DRAFT_2217073 [Mycena sp. CBHHK59/15]